MLILLKIVRCIQNAQKRGCKEIRQVSLIEQESNGHKSGHITNNLGKESGVSNFNHW